jgi:hypothetical protein
MAVRTTIDIPEPLHDRLRVRAAASGTSIRALVVRAIEQTYPSAKKGKRLTGPPVDTKGKKLGPRFPVYENPHDLILP